MVQEKVTESGWILSQVLSTDPWWGFSLSLIFAWIGKLIFHAVILTKYYLYSPNSSLLVGSPRKLFMGRSNVLAECVCPSLLVTGGVSCFANSRCTQVLKFDSSRRCKLSQMLLRVSELLQMVRLFVFPGYHTRCFNCSLFNSCKKAFLGCGSWKFQCFLSLLQNGI